MSALPLYVYVLFIATVVFTLFLWTVVTRRSVTALIVVSLWLIIQGIISLSGFYTETAANPPHFPALILPPLFIIVLLLSSRWGRNWIDGWNNREIYLVHLVRVPVELVLNLLFLNKTVPELMTFSGTNFDILSGLTAPVIYYFGVVKKQLPGIIMLLWNLVCIALLGNIVYHAVFSAPLPIQKFGFDQPNIALLYFPFTWLPAFIVPFVLFAHLVAIRNLVYRSQTQMSIPGTFIQHK